MQIRLAGHEDYEQLLQLLRQLHPDDPVPSDAERAIFEEILASGSLRLLVAADRDMLLGCCYLNLVPNLTRGGRPYALIENVITDAARRNLGIGKALIGQALALARQANCYKVMLMSGRKDPAVHAFYKKCGFAADEKQAYVLREL